MVIYSGDCYAQICKGGEYSVCLLPSPKWSLDISLCWGQQGEVKGINFDMLNVIDVGAEQLMVGPSVRHSAPS